MYCLKPVNILTVNRCRLFVVAALVTFWCFFFSFLLAPLWASGVLALLHVLALYLAVSSCYKLLVFMFLSREGEGDELGAFPGRERLPIT